MKVKVKPKLTIVKLKVGSKNFNAVLLEKRKARKIGRSGKRKLVALMPASPI